MQPKKILKLDPKPKQTEEAPWALALQSLSLTIRSCERRTSITSVEACIQTFVKGLMCNVLFPCHGVPFSSGRKECEHPIHDHA